MKDHIYVREALPQIGTGVTPLQRLEAAGTESLRDGELLMLCLGLNEEKAKLLLEDRSLAELANLPYPELKKLLGKARAPKLSCAFEIVRRALDTGIGVLQSIGCPVDVLPFLMEIKGQSKEHFLCLYLNARHQVIHKEIISIGSLSASIVHPREVFAVALQHFAASIVLTHNHPSGDCSASQDDIDLTRRLTRAGEIMGIDILDHIIVSDESFLSMKEMGLI